MIEVHSGAIIWLDKLNRKFYNGGTL